ncbi:APC family permease [Carnimonas bestiolae]|uniref:APC family permease n=1 Tax=Carnimonas bestiolae TaxID=3402172 RepID=UPI003EDBE724
MESSGDLKKGLGLLDLTLLGVGSMIGSGWLFAGAKSAALAGSDAGWAWLLGAVIILLIALTFAELASALPRAGGFLRYPNFTHGNVVGFVIGVSSLLAYTSTAGVEVEAVREYAVTWWPALQAASGGPSTLGFVFQIALLVLFFLINYWSVKAFGRVNTVVTFFKFIVPLMVIVTLFGFFTADNLAVAPPPPGGLHGIFSSLTGAGIAFSYLGFRQAVDFASEAKNPQRDIPLAILIALGISFVVYLLLQYAYLGAVPNSVLSEKGWDGVASLYSSPYADIAIHLGLGWLTSLVLVDAVISPAGTGNIYIAGASRVLFAWAKNGHLFELFSRVDPKSGVPRGALWLSLIISIAWTLPSNFQVWGGLISACTSAMVFTYMPGSTSLAAFRARMPQMQRPFSLPFHHFLSPLTMIACTFLLYWSGWNVVSVLVPILVAAWVLYALFGSKNEESANDIHSAWWLLFYYVALMLVSCFGSFDGSGALSGTPENILIVVIALITYYWGSATALKAPRINHD